MRFLFNLSFLLVAFFSAIASDITEQQIEIEHIKVTTLPIKASSEFTQSDQIKRDSTILSEILTRHKGNQMAYDPDYAKIGDTLIAAHPTAVIPTSQKENYAKVIQLYQADKEACCLNSVRITWLAVQLAMALTPPEKMITNSRAVDTLIDLIKADWLKDLKDLEKADAAGKQSYFSLLQINSLFRTPLIVYTGNSGFSLQDYHRTAAQGFDLASYNPGTGQGHYVHGGIYPTPISKLVHDLHHVTQQWFIDSNLRMNYAQFCQDPENLERYRYYSKLWHKFAEVTNNILCDATIKLTDKEKSQLEVMSFLALHETVGPIPEILKGFKNPTLIDIALKAITTWHEENWQFFTLPDNEKDFYKQLFSRHTLRDYSDYKLRDITSIKADTQKGGQVNVTFILQSKKNPKEGRNIELFFSEMRRYETMKTFLRDLAHMLIQKGLWKPASKKLGTTYNMSEVRIVLQEAYDWYVKELGRKGKLYPHFIKVKLPEKPEFNKKQGSK